MISQFWKWLSRANARAALLAASIAFVLTVAYWVWREMEHAENAPVAPSGLAAPGKPVTNRVELLAFIQIQQKNREKAMTNPFFHRPTWKPDPKTPGPDANPDNAVPPKKGNDTPPKQALPPTPPPPKEAPVLYRGSMTRPDGARTALIENQNTKKQHYFTAGDTFLNATVEAIEPDSVTLKTADGATLVLTRGQVAKMRED